MRMLNLEFGFPMTTYLVVSGMAPDQLCLGEYRPNEFVDSIFSNLSHAEKRVQEKRQEAFAVLARDVSPTESWVARWLEYRNSFRIVRAKLEPNG